MLDRTDDWEPLERPRFHHLQRRLNPDQPGRTVGRTEVPVKPAPVRRIIRAIRAQTRD